MKSLKQLLTEDDGSANPYFQKREFTEETENEMKGGKGERSNPDDFDQDELMKGIYHEMEHTDKIRVAMEIAIDHLTEDEHYYSHLAKCGIEKEEEVD